MTTARAAELLRGPEDPREPTFLELFFDLAFVFALSQLSQGLLQHLRWSGALRTLVLLLAMWWVWATTTWATDRLNPRRPAVQLLVILTLFGSVVLSATLPAAFGKYGLAFAGVHVTIQLGRNVFLVFALRGNELERIMPRSLLWWGVSAMPWIAGGLTHGTGRMALWALAATVDYAAYTFGYPLPGAGRVPGWEPPGGAQHLAERNRQFFIIALGELILVSGLALSGGGLTPERIAAVLVSIATTALLWRIYLYRASEVLPAALAAVPDPARLARAVAYAHLIMVAGIVVTAVGLELVVAHPSGRTPLAWAVVIRGGPVLFLAGRSLFEYAVFARVSWDRPLGVLVLAALTPLAHLAPRLLDTIAATAVLAAIATSDAARARRHPAEPPSPPTRASS